ncbi:hypothetical protein [Olleya namhaensis]|nr:hypothetical protein [Olleya namhaensis]
MNFKTTLVFPLLVLMLFFSCQNEESEIVNQQDDLISGNSTIANLISNTVLNDGSIDNIIDYANCLEVVLPVTITTNGVTVTIESITDYNVLETLLEAFTTDDDIIGITFPITVVLNDYSQIVINNQDELEGQIENCNGENEADDDIECIDFQYPIAFSIYNTDFQVTEVTIIEDDQALYLFLESLQGPILASLNFPVTMVLANGDTIEVNSNQELENAINDADGNCDEDDDYDYTDDNDCTQIDVSDYLLSCGQIPSLNGYTPSFTTFSFQDNTIISTLFEGDLFYDGSWDIATIGGYLYVFIDFNGLEEYNGQWKVVECASGELILEQGDDTLVLLNNCNTANLFDCFEDITVTICDNDDTLDLFTAFDIDTIYQDCAQNDLVVYYYNTNADAEASINALVSPYTNMANPDVLYARVELANDPNTFQIFEVTILVENCFTSCTEDDVDGTLQMCVWTITNYAGDSSFDIFDINFQDDQNMTIASDTETYTGNWATSGSSGQVVVSFSNISGGNVQVLNGDFNVVECTGEQMILHDVSNSNNELVLDKDCI